MPSPHNTIFVMRALSRPLCAKFSASRQPSNEATTTCFNSRLAAARRHQPHCRPAAFVQAPLGRVLAALRVPTQLVVFGQQLKHAPHLTR